MKSKVWLLFLSSVLLAAASAWCVRGPQYLSGRALGMGDAFVALSDDYSGIYYNPAGLARLNTPEKNWKFSVNDVKERACWDDYQEAFEGVFNHTSTKWAPWYVIPANHKWFAHAAVADIIISKLKSLQLQYPTVSKERMRELVKAKELLENES